MEEIWKDIKGYEGLYQASNLGRVKSVKRIIRRIDGKIKTFKERILSPSDDGNGYCQVGLNKNGIRKTSKIHKLVAMAFLGHKPCGRAIVVDHIDNDKLNNRVDNLQITTNRYNSSKDKKGVSKYTGVSWDNQTNKWRSQIYINGKQKHLGRYKNELEAHEAYQNALKEINN